MLVHKSGEQRSRVDIGSEREVGNAMHRTHDRRFGQLDYVRIGRWGGQSRRSRRNRISRAAGAAAATRKPSIGDQQCDETSSHEGTPPFKAVGYLSIRNVFESSPLSRNPLLSAGYGGAVGRSSGRSGTTSARSRFCDALAERVNRQSRRPARSARPNSAPRAERALVERTPSVESPKGAATSHVIDGQDDSKKNRHSRKQTENERYAD